jgi:hypothetical protein
MSEFQMKSHSVTARRIESLAPLHVGERLAAPDVGALLILEDGQKIRWVPEAAAPIPQAQDWFVQDTDFGVAFIVTPAKFDEFFTPGD